MCRHLKAEKFAKVSDKCVAKYKPGMYFSVPSFKYKDEEKIFCLYLWLEGW